MDDYYDMQKSFNYELIESNFTTTPNSYPFRNSKINFKFSFNFEVIAKWIPVEDDDEEESQLVFRSKNPKIDYNVSVGFDRFSSTEETRKYMEEKLNGLPVDPDDRQDLVDYAMCEASKHVTKCSDNYRPVGGAYYRVLSLHFNVLLEHEYIYLDEEIDDDYESASIRMVPARDSSIQVLKKVAAAEYSRRNMDCSICLEKLSGGDDGGDHYREAWSMPCSHIFHGDCIKNWLRVSHYCPLCRFEMPTD